MSEKIRLNRKQVEFLKEWTEEEDPEKGVELFGRMMILEKVDPVDMAFVIDEIIKRLNRKKIT